MPDDAEPDDTSPDGPTPDELKRQFEAAIAGMELDELRDLTRTLQARGRPSLVVPPRQKLRRPPLLDAVTFRIRVDLDGSRPPIWRRLDIASDAALDAVHQVLQAAFGWTNSHLHRFSLGGGPFDPTSEVFLCPYDIEEGDDGGAPASEVRLDETMQAPGDVLRYIYDYDYGDGWQLTLQLEEVRVGRPTTDSAIAVCIDGRRAAPPEDCGGITAAAELAAVLDDPGHFDVDEVNQALRDPYFMLREAGLDPRLVDLAHQLRANELGDELLVRLWGLMGPPALPSRGEMADALRPVTWFLERGSGDGLALTSAGYLKPADVEEICAILPTMAEWFGKNNRETHAHPLQEFRAWLQANGLIRKNKGRLLTTRAGAKLRGDPGALWDHLASRLVPTNKDTFAEQCALVLIAYVATSADAEVPFTTVARVLHELGWRHANQQRLHDYDLYRVEGSPLPLLYNVGEAPERRGFREPIHPIAAALAHYSLVRGPA